MFAPFGGLGTSFWMIWGVLGDHFETILVIMCARVHSGEPTNILGLIFQDFQWIWGHPLGTHLETFSDSSVIWSVKKSTWIAVMKFDDFSVENVMVSDVPTYQICSKY